jgi:hypothetical protein
LTTGFDPAIHGFAFANDFVTNVSFGGVHFSTHGLCGGMIYAANDYYMTGTPIPRWMKDLPSDRSPHPESRQLWHYIFDRQVDSFAYVAPRIIDEKLDFLSSSSEVYWEGLTTELGLLNTAMSRGAPVPLGLIAPGLTFTDNHQVLAIHLTSFQPRDAHTSIRIYDPNSPGVTSYLIAQAGSDHFTEVLGDGGTKDWRTFFVDSAYRVHRPPPLPLPRVPAHPQVAGGPSRLAHLETRAQFLGRP